MSTDKSLAQGQLESMVGKLRALADLGHAIHALRGDVIDRETVAAALNETTTPDKIGAALDVFDEFSEDEIEDLNSGSPLGNVWLSGSLEFYADARKSLNGDGTWDVRKIGALLGFGGPTIRVETDVAIAPSWVTVSVSWGEGVEQEVFCAPIASALSDMEDLF